MTEVGEKSRIAIVGGGLVGALAACFFAKRGYRVVIYEYRSDIRMEKSRGQSINLALSFRGREALKAIGLEDILVNRHGTCMRGRMLHDKDGNLKEVLYDSVRRNCIYSINRRYLNVVLLNAAEKYPEVQLNFNRKLVNADLENGKMKFLNSFLVFSTNTGTTEDAEADLIIGADGAHSKVRKIMTRRPLFNCAQTYIEHGYVEISVPRKEDNECKPYHVGKTAVLIGDAAHAMVPFYAQGMNAGFEDILVLDELMELYDSDFAKVLSKFSELRCDEGHAICDLAMYNYLEMRDLVTRKSFLFRKFLDKILYTLIPNSWIPLYFAVQFTRLSFRECIAHKEWQDKVLRMSVLCLGFLIFAVLAVPLLRNAI
ncbi:kynurenine 3-monooxygenase cn isoform X3 [Temnothorax americanus]|uniref:kynurenine 3-monooxygenase cn isoform X3 n=1 Tax=Temnothorax americanus TaxID=1964332 RepID=UPI0040685AC6